MSFLDMHQLESQCQNVLSNYNENMFKIFDQLMEYCKCVNFVNWKLSSNIFDYISTRGMNEFRELKFRGENTVYSHKIKTNSGIKTIFIVNFKIPQVSDVDFENFELLKLKRKKCFELLKTTPFGQIREVNKYISQLKNECENLLKIQLFKLFLSFKFFSSYDDALDAFAYSRMISV